MPKKSDVKVNEDIFGRFEAEQIALGKSESTVNVYLRDLRKFNEYLEQTGSQIDLVTRFDVQDYIDKLVNDGRSASTIDRIYAAVSVFATFLDRPNIVKNIRKPKKQQTSQLAPKSLNRSDVKQLQRNVERNSYNSDRSQSVHGLRNIAIVYMLLHAGLRVSELCALDRKDVELSRGGSVKVIGKGNKQRSIPLSSEVRVHLENYLARRDDDPALFLSNYNKRMSVRSVQRMLEKYDIHPHTLRHTFCRTLVEAGVDLATVAQLAGHETIEVTRRYAMPDDEAMAGAIMAAFVK
jgi:integrase/recombinase XerD